MSQNGFTPEFLASLSERELVALLVTLTDPSDREWLVAVQDEIKRRKPEREN